MRPGCLCFSRPRVASTFFASASSHTLTHTTKNNTAHHKKGHHDGPHTPPRTPCTREDTASLGGSVLVLNTGRSKGQLMDLLSKKEDIIAVPDVIITAVGTKIWHRRSTHRAFGGCTSDDYEEDLAWTTRLDHAWDLEAARKIAADVSPCGHGGGDGWGQG